MVNDIEVENPRRDLLIKFADDMTLSAPVKSNLLDPSLKEVENIVNWSKDNGRVLRWLEAKQKKNNFQIQYHQLNGKLH